jgi:hypothetical protein
MIEVTLLSVRPGDYDPMVARCVARNRFDKENLKTSIPEFIKGFLKNNINNFSGNMGNSDVVEAINSSSTFTTKDVACINYYLTEIGYSLLVQNVTDDEENPTGVPAGGVVEWNIINKNFLQYDYPTATKIIPGDGTEIPEILRKVVEQQNLFDRDKFAGLKNPFTELLNDLDAIKRTTGSVSSSITTKIYSLLDRLNFKVICIAGED